MANKESFYLEGKNNIGVLLLHTLADNPLQMLELGKKLNKHGYSVSCPLYKGHGGTFLDVIQTDVTDWYDTVVEAYEELSTKTEGVFAVGMSIGGTFAVKLAQEQNLRGLITINAPIIGFDILSDVFEFSKNTKNEELIERYRAHRMNYFHFVTKLGQMEQLNKITCPFFALQGSLDMIRYKTSTMMLMEYVHSDVKQRKDYGKSFHLLLLENDKKEAMKDILKFIEEN